MTTHQSDTPELAAIMRAAVGEAIAKIHTSMPAKIVSYDRATQRAVVQPAIQGKYRDPVTEEVVNVELPQIARVPVAFPSAAGFSITWDLSAGDPVTLIFAERSLDEWLTTGNGSNEAADPRRFDLSDAIAIPGGRSFADAIPPAGVESGTMVIRAPLIKLGSASASKWIALADDVKTRLNAIESAFNTHTHTIPILTVTGVTVGAGAAVTTPNSSGASGTAGSTSLADIKSDVVKSE